MRFDRCRWCGEQINISSDHAPKCSYLTLTREMYIDLVEASRHYSAQTGTEVTLSPGNASIMARRLVELGYTKGPQE
jgi:hypothetical protein